MEDTAADNGGNKLLNEENQEDTRDSREVEVVDEEEGLELEGLTVAHQLATTEDDGVVDDNEDRGRLESRHGRLKGDELEVLGRVADDHLPALAEDGPQVDAKGAVDRGHGKVVEERHDGQQKRFFLF